MACSLDAGDLETRRRQLAEIGAGALLGVEGDGRAPSLRFCADPRTEAGLEAIVRAESECCPFLDLKLERAGNELILRIEAPEGGDPVAAALVAAFEGRANEANPDPR
jgi:hypothetical protein